MKQDLKAKTLLLLASSVFCLGFLITIVDGYYEYNYYHFIDIGRKDLIARLGFLSWATGFLYYPTILVLLLLISWILKWTKKNLIRKQWVYILAPAILTGVLFYTHSVDFLLMEDIRYWRIGLTMMVIAIATYWICLRWRSKKTKHNIV